MDARLVMPTPPLNSDLDVALDMLKQADFHARWDAVKVISDLGEGAISPLLSLLQSESDWEVQWFIIRILGNLQQPDTIPALVDCLVTTDHADVAAMAAVSLSSFGQTAIAPLVSVLYHIPTRLLTVQALTQIRHPQALSPLLQVAEDSNPEVRAVAMEALGHFHDAPEVLPVLLAALQDPAAPVRRAAVMGLGFQAEGWQQVSRLQPLLDDLNLEVAQQTAIALGRMGTPEAVAMLNQALLNSPEVLQIEMIRAIARVGTDLALDGLQVFGQTAENVVKQEMVTVLGRLENPQMKGRATEILLQFLAAGGAGARGKQAIALSLGQLGQVDALDALIQLLADADAGVRFHAIAALKQFEMARQRLEQLATSEGLSRALRDGVALALREW
jgi:HEAT repeat protein